MDQNIGISGRAISSRGELGRRGRWMYSIHRDTKEQEARRQETQLMHAMQARGLVPGP